MAKLSNAHYIMMISSRIETIMEFLEKKGIATKDEIRKREVEVIKEQLEKIRKKGIAS